MVQNSIVWIIHNLYSIVVGHLSPLKISFAQISFYSEIFYVFCCLRYRYRHRHRYTPKCEISEFYITYIFPFGRCHQRVFQSWYTNLYSTSREPELELFQIFANTLYYEFLKKQQFYGHKSISNWGFNLHLLGEQWVWMYFHIFEHFVILFCNVPIEVCLHISLS